MDPEQQSSRSKGKKVELIVQQLDSLPTLPAVAVRLLQITVKSNTQAEEVVRLIESDQSLASKIIALATHAGTGITRRTASVSKAVVLLGFDAVRNAVLSIKVFETLGGHTSAGSEDFNRMEFWKHSLAVACATKMLIKHVDPRVDPEEAFICGLLHDMGKVALDACLPKSFARVVQLTESSLANIAEVEQKIMGIDHTIVGKRLAEKWHLPDTIAETVWLHHQSPQALPEAIHHRTIVKTVHLADLLAREQRIGYSGNHAFPESSAAVAAQLGCPAGAVEQIARVLRQEISERAVILGLDEIEPEELYHEALAKANSELARLNVRLQHEMHHLQARSRYFLLLSELGRTLKAGHTVVDVCSLLAELWQRHLNCPRCAVYACTPGDMTIEGAVKLQEEINASVFLVDRADDPDRAAPDFSASSIPARVGDTHGWFFEQVAPMFRIDATFMLPLSGRDEIVGALLWEQTDPAAESSVESEGMAVFAAAAALALLQAQKQEKQNVLCEQLAQTNKRLHDAQRELLQTRSMAAVGEMACGAAHEINNPLAVVVGRSQLLASSEEDADRKEMLDAIARQGREIAQIISELMEFAKPALPQPAPTHVADLVNQALQLQAEHARQQNVALETRLEDDLTEVFIDAEQVGSALSELISNAIESYLGQGGAVTVTARCHQLDPEVVLEVIDQGCGMDDQTLRKAFDPFFSARRAGRSRGLGLSRSSRQIEGNGGHIYLMSEPGKGTVARVVLPLAQVNQNSEPVAHLN